MFVFPIMHYASCIIERCISTSLIGWENIMYSEIYGMHYTKQGYLKLHSEFTLGLYNHFNSYSLRWTFLSRQPPLPTQHQHMLCFWTCGWLEICVKIFSIITVISNIWGGDCILTFWIGLKCFGRFGVYFASTNP